MRESREERETEIAEGFTQALGNGPWAEIAWGSVRVGTTDGREDRGGKQISYVGLWVLALRDRPSIRSPADWQLRWP